MREKTTIIRTLLLGILAAAALTACAPDERVDDLEWELNKLKKELENPANQQADPAIKLGEGDSIAELKLYPGETRTIPVDAPGIEDIIATTGQPGVTVRYDEEKTQIVLTAPAEVSEGSFKVFVTGSDASGRLYRTSLLCSSLGYVDPLTTFVLNEGNAFGGEMGFMGYVSPTGQYLDKPFFAINDQDLGVLSQDMGYASDKLYVIAQGSYGATDGTLTVMDCRTLRMTARYKSELTDVNTPTHLAILDDDHIYIRHEGGVSRFSEQTKKTTFVEGSERADKNTMLTLDGKVFFHSSMTLCVVEGGDKVDQKVDFPGIISGIAKADDEHLYVSYGTDEAGCIALVRTSDYAIEKTNTLPPDEGGSALKTGWAATSTIAAKGDTLYFGEGMSNSIYRHLFSTGETKPMWSYKEGNPDHKQTYQTPAVHPITGMVWCATMQDFGEPYKINTLYELDLKGEEGKANRTWQDILRFPAGFFFPFAD